MKTEGVLGCVTKTVTSKTGEKINHFIDEMTRVDVETLEEGKLKDKLI